MYIWSPSTCALRLVRIEKSRSRNHCNIVTSSDRKACVFRYKPRHDRDFREPSSMEPHRQGQRSQSEIRGYDLPPLVEAVSELTQFGMRHGGEADIDRLRPESVPFEARGWR